MSRIASAENDLTFHGEQQRCGGDQVEIGWLHFAILVRMELLWCFHPDIQFSPHCSLRSLSAIAIVRGNPEINKHHHLFVALSIVSNDLETN